MNINYLHFDTAQREDLTTDSFSCELKLSNPLQKVKKIYLKSVEMPVGFFNIRQTQYFEYVSSPINFEFINPRQLSLFAYNPKIENNYNTNEDSNSFYTFTRHTSAPGVGTQQQQNAYRISIAIVPGNYTITTLLSYINEKLNKLFVIQETNFKAIAEFPFTPQFSLSTVDSSDSSIFPVGYVRASFSSI